MGKQIFVSAMALSCLMNYGFAGYSPVTHVSSDDHPYSPYGSSYEQREVSDPTYFLEENTGWPSQQEEFSDTLYPVLR